MSGRCVNQVAAARVGAADGPADAAAAAAAAGAQFFLYDNDAPSVESLQRYARATVVGDAPSPVVESVAARPGAPAGGWRRLAAALSGRATAHATAALVLLVRGGVRGDGAA